MRQRRITELLMKYWKQLKGKRRFPAESELSPEALKDFWDSCFLIDLTDFADRGGFKYAYLGSNLIKAYGDQLTQEEAVHLISTSNVEVAEKIRQVMRSRAPLSIEGEFTNTSNVLIRFREVMLPLGKSEDKVDYIIGGMRWKSF
jgi:hypothetical protein